MSLQMLTNPTLDLILDWPLLSLVVQIWAACDELRYSLSPRSPSHMGLIASAHRSHEDNSHSPPLELHTINVAGDGTRSSGPSLPDFWRKLNALKALGICRSSLASICDYAIANTASLYLCQQSLPLDANVEHAILDAIPHAPDINHLTTFLSRLAACFQRRQELTFQSQAGGCANDSERSIILLSAALRSVDDDGKNEHISIYLRTLGRSFESRSLCNPVSIDDSSIRSYAFAAAFLPTHTSIEDGSKYLNDLAAALLCRYERRRDPSGLSMSITLLKHVLDNFPKFQSPRQADMHGHMEFRATVLHNLGLAYRHRFIVGNDPKHRDIDDAVKHLNVARSCSPTDLQLTNSLANTLLIRDKYRGAVLSNSSVPGTDIEDAIHLHRSTRSLMPFPHHERSHISERFDSFAAAMQRRYERRGSRDVNELKFIIILRLHAITYTLPDDPSLPRRQLNLALAYYSYIRSCTSLHVDMSNQALSLAKRAALANYADPPIRLRAAHLWAVLDPCSIAAYQIFFNFLPHALRLGLDVSHQYWEISDISGVVHRGVAAAVNTASAARKSRNDPKPFLEKALLWFEIGRCIVWQQALNLGITLSDQIHPNVTLTPNARFLVDDVDKQARRLQEAFLSSPPDIPISYFYDQTYCSLLASDYHSAVNRASSDVELKDIPAVRHLRRSLTEDGETTILRDLRSAALSGHVVCITVSETRADAIILREGGGEILHEPLPLFKLDLVERMLKTFQPGAPRAYGQQSSGRQLGPDIHYNGRTHVQTISIKEALGLLWSSVVNPVLSRLNLIRVAKDKAGDLPRIIWCPSGALSLLPLHAAGNYNHTSILGLAVFDMAHINKSAMIPLRPHFSLCCKLEINSCIPKPK
ncbi:hypothetical protein K488DRAFT_85049 [Vararia minispora EC-137]|uniref:Uncharacterized protein n=1 Tax=Vararia minispora EC-137 TaxID=1314806 RepID=A0ACB8QNM6_9AGAM|nr:hypothetical protein K488DRAFT_85049 [Vararia minispora EC-137]